MSVKISGTVRVNVYNLLSDQVEGWVQYGWNRAHKHVDRPDELAICNAIEESVMSGLCEFFNFDHPCCNDYDDNDV